MRKKLPDGSIGWSIAKQLEAITLEKIADIGIAHANANEAWIKKGKSITALRETSLMDGTDALVIASGPSVHRQKETAKMIRDSRFKGIIVAADSAMSWCLRNDIVPDLVVTLDPHPDRMVRWFGDPNLTSEKLVKDDYFARQDMDPRFNEDQLKFNKELVDIINRFGAKIRIAICTSASQAVVKRAYESSMMAYWWNPMYDDYEMEGSLTRRVHEMNGLPCINAGGNAGTACWVLAHAILGKKRIGLVGMDLGYYAETPYNRTQYYKEVLDLVGEDHLDEVFVHFQNPHLNQEFYTDPAYLWYRNSFLEMAGETDCETYNCTGGGILFGPEIIWAALSDFLSLSKT